MNAKILMIRHLTIRLIINPNECSAIIFIKLKFFIINDEYLKKRFIIDHGQLQFDKADGWTLIGIPEKEYESLSDNEYFLHT